jgi:hypothetical protein
MREKLDQILEKSYRVERIVRRCIMVGTLRQELSDALVGAKREIEELQSICKDCLREVGDG